MTADEIFKPDGHVADDGIAPFVHHTLSFYVTNPMWELENALLKINLFFYKMLIVQVKSSQVKSSQVVIMIKLREDADEEPVQSLIGRSYLEIEMVPVMSCQY